MDWSILWHVFVVVLGISLMVAFLRGAIELITKRGWVRWFATIVMCAEVALVAGVLAAKS